MWTKIKATINKHVYKYDSWLERLTEKHDNVLIKMLIIIGLSFLITLATSPLILLGVIIFKLIKKG